MGHFCLGFELFWIFLQGSLQNYCTLVKTNQTTLQQLSLSAFSTCSDVSWPFYIFEFCETRFSIFIKIQNNSFKKAKLQISSQKKSNMNSKVKTQNDKSSEYWKLFSVLLAEEMLLIIQISTFSFLFSFYYQVAILFPGSQNCSCWQIHQAGGCLCLCYQSLEPCQVINMS